MLFNISLILFYIWSHEISLLYLHDIIRYDKI